MTYRIVRSARKTIAIQITPAGEVIVRCPARMRIGDIERFVESKRSWIETSKKSARSCRPLRRKNFLPWQSR